MAILLNALNLLLCIWLFHRFGTIAGRMAGIVFIFLGGTVLSFAISLALAHDYLDGVQHLVIAGGCVLLFWIVALIMVIRRRQVVRLVPSVAIVCIVLVVPAVLWLLFANMQFKIGG